MRHTKRWASAIYATITISDKENEKNCISHGVKWLSWPNAPLGAKHNAALELAKADTWDAVMILPSDDFVDPLYVLKAMDAIRNGADYVFPEACGLYDTATGRACILHNVKGQSLKFGAGRIVSRRVVDAVGPLWTPEKMRGLDTDSHGRIRAHGFTEVVVGIAPGVPCLTDVKTGTNLWAFDAWAKRGERATVDRVLGMVDTDVSYAIRALR